MGATAAHRDVASPPRSRTSVRRRRRPLLAALAVLALVLASSGTAGATGGKGHGGHDPREPQLLVDGLVGPLSIEVGWFGDVLVGQSFAGTISNVSRRGQVRDLVSEPGAEVAAHGPLGTVLYTVLQEDGTQLLKVRLPWGATRLLANLSDFEAAHNPDGDSTYGVVGLSDECAAQWPVEEAGPPSYTGIVESHAYKLAPTPWGVYVADAAANAILFVEWSGRVRTVAVLPPQPLTIPDDPTGLGLPACAAGLTYNFEPVPTDIELAWTGAFVTLLPGGPEDPSLGARGSVHKVDLRKGTSRQVAGGLLAATDLAVSPRGDVYVTELFGGRLSRLTRNGPVTVAELDTPAAVEWHAGKLYVAHEVFGSGKISILRG